MLTFDDLIGGNPPSPLCRLSHLVARAHRVWVFLILCVVMLEYCHEIHRCHFLSSGFHGANDTVARFHNKS